MDKSEQIYRAVLSQLPQTLTREEHSEVWQHKQEAYVGDILGRVGVEPDPFYVQKPWQPL